LVLDSLAAAYGTPVFVYDEAHLRARVVETAGSGDQEAEREATITLARLLASRGRDLGLATRLARRALTIAEDAGLDVVMGVCMMSTHRRVGAESEQEE
jgi:predicted Fe-Mo cluster-binding NifX family protein